MQHYNYDWNLPLSASGIGRCEINNGGCWQESKDGKTISACSVSKCCFEIFAFFPFHFVYIFETKFGILQNEVSEGCKYPVGFKGDGEKSCEGIIQKIVVYILEFNIVLKGQKLIVYLYILDQKKPCILSTEILTNLGNSRDTEITKCKVQLNQLWRKPRANPNKVTVHITN